MAGANGKRIFLVTPPLMGDFSHIVLFFILFIHTNAYKL